MQPGEVFFFMLLQLVFVIIFFKNKSNKSKYFYHPGKQLFSVLVII